MPNAFAHIELNTDNVAKARTFHKGLFKWKMHTMARGYTGIDVGKGPGAGGGMQKKPMPKAPTKWLPYVQVDDVKTTVAKAHKLGANIQLEHGGRRHGRHRRLHRSHRRADRCMGPSQEERKGEGREKEGQEEVVVA